MLNDTQKELCQTSIDFISNSLNDILKISETNANALNSAFLALRLSMKYDAVPLKNYLKRI